MTPSMTRQRRRLLIPIIHLITRIYHAYRLCTNQVCPPFAFRINQGRLVPVSPSLVRDLPSFATPFYQPKVLYHQVTFPCHWVLFACTLYIMYYQSCRFCLICTNTSYVTLDFFILFTSMSGPLFSFLIVRKVALVAFSGNNASVHFGVGVLFHSGLNLCYQLTWWTKQLHSIVFCENWMAILIHVQTTMPVVVMNNIPISL